MGHDTRPSLENGRIHWLWLIARKQPGASDTEIEAASNLVYTALLEELHGRSPKSFRETAIGQRLRTEPGSVGLSVLREQFGKPLQLLMGAVVLVLLIACANVSGLLLARGAARQRELALRVSLGAGRTRLFRQSLAESLLFGLLGSAAGLAVAAISIRALPLLLPDSGEATALSFGINGTVLTFAGSVAFLCVLLFGAFPAVQAGRVSPAPALKAGGASAVGTGHSFRLRKPLVAGQFALSFALVVLALLFSRTLGNLRTAEPGLHNPQLLTFWISGPKSYGEERMARRWEEAHRRLGELPGVRQIALASPGPYRMGTANTTVEGPGIVAARSEDGSPGLTQFQKCTPDYLRMIGARLVAGRYFTENDGEGVAVVNERFVQDFFNGRNPVGERVEAVQMSRRIVGVVSDVRHYGLREPQSSFLYLPAGASYLTNVAPLFLLEVAGRTEAAIPTISEEIRSLDPQLALSNPRTMAAHVERSVQPERMLSVLCNIFAGLALLLSSVGLYGVMAQWVAERRHEIGVRLALGARSANVAGAVVRRGLLLTAGGLLAGVPLAFATARLGESLFFGVNADAPDIWMLCLVLPLAAALLALLAPLRDALGLQPSEILRAE